MVLNAWASSIFLSYYCSPYSCSYHTSSISFELPQISLIILNVYDFWAEYYIFDLSLSFQFCSTSHKLYFLFLTRVPLLKDFSDSFWENCQFFNKIRFKIATTPLSFECSKICHLSILLNFYRLSLLKENRKRVELWEKLQKLSAIRQQRYSFDIYKLVSSYYPDHPNFCSYSPPKIGYFLSSFHKL